MKWRNWEIVRWPLSLSWWCINWGWWPNPREPTFYFWNLLFLEIRKYGSRKNKICKKCKQEIPNEKTFT